METLISQTSFDCVEQLLFHEQTTELLPVLGSSALDQVLQQPKLVTPPCSSSSSSSTRSSLDMERMSPDSSMDWTQQQRVPAVADVTVNSAINAQPDSTTNEFAYDSDAFNSDDSNESFAELQMNPNLLANLTSQQQRRNPADDASSTCSSSPATPKVDFSKHFAKFPPSPANSISSCEDLSQRQQESPKTKPKKKKSKRAGLTVLKCEFCTYTTRFKEHLTSHMNTHNDNRNHMCSDCGQTFKWSHSLKRHQRKHQADFKYACSFCHKAFSRKDHLVIHENLHRGTNETFPCGECGATFKNKKTLAGHAKTHSAEKQFKCDQCESEFTRRASLMRHVRATHAGQVIPCPLCPATFSYRSTLEDHKKAVHNDGKREFTCGLCGVPFAVKAYLSKHMVTCRNRADGKSFACSLCTKSFPTKRHLHEHTKRKHSNNNNNEMTKDAEQKLKAPQPGYNNVGHFLQYPPQQQPAFSYAPQAEEQKPLPAFQQHYNPQSYHHHHQQQQQPRSFACELCHATFPEESALETHLLGHLPNPAHHNPHHPATSSSQQHQPPPMQPVVNDLPLPQVQEPGEENVGSLLRLVYGVADQSSSSSSAPPSSDQAYDKALQHDYQARMYAEGPKVETLMDYPILEGFPIDCL